MPGTLLLLLLARTTTGADPLRRAAPTRSTSAAATSTTASSSAATASTSAPTPTTTPTTTPTATPTPSASSTAASTAAACSPFALAPLALAWAASPARGRRRSDRLKTNKAVKHHIRVLTKRSRRMEIDVEMDPVWSEFRDALGPEVMARAVEVMRAVGIDGDTVQVHSALAIPPHNRMERGNKGQVIKASPGEQKFSHVQIEGQGGVWYGRCLMLFHFTDASQHVVRRAIVKYYTELDTPCLVTGCRRLRLTMGRDDYVVLEVDSILGLAHIVPSFTEPDISLVNRFLF
ncbi:unnamed protein product [Closterium sp. Yama58-4]|nr:unnamed protein product [Closterium sp. Yama58-4]